MAIKNEPGIRYETPKQIMRQFNFISVLIFFGATAAYYAFIYVAYYMVFPNMKTLPPFPPMQVPQGDPLAELWSFGLGKGIILLGPVVAVGAAVSYRERNWESYKQRL